MKALLAMAALLAPGLAVAGLDGVTASAQLDASTGGLDQRTATVGAGAEFTGSITSGLAAVAIDLTGPAIVLTVVNQSTGNELNPDGVISLDWQRLQLTSLRGPAGPISALVLIESSFPAGTFDDTEVTGDSIRWELHGVRMPGKGKQWRAVWEVGVGNR